MEGTDLMMLLFATWKLSRKEVMEWTGRFSLVSWFDILIYSAL